MQRRRIYPGGKRQRGRANGEGQDCAEIHKKNCLIESGPRYPSFQVTKLQQPTGLRVNLEHMDRALKSQVVAFPRRTAGHVAPHRGGSVVALSVIGRATGCRSVKADHLPGRIYVLDSGF